MTYPPLPLPADDREQLARALFEAHAATSPTPPATTWEDCGYQQAFYAWVDAQAPVIGRMLTTTTVKAEQAGREDNATHAQCYVHGSRALAEHDKTLRAEAASQLLEALRGWPANVDRPAPDTQQRVLRTGLDAAGPEQDAAAAAAFAGIQAQALRDAADAWDAESVDDLAELAEQRYRPGGPSMPTIYLRLRAARIEARSNV